MVENIYNMKYRNLAGTFSNSICQIIYILYRDLGYVSQMGTNGIKRLRTVSSSNIAFISNNIRMGTKHKLFKYFRHIFCAKSKAEKFIGRINWD